MTRGTSNEAAALPAPSATPFVKSVFECGMIAKADIPWMTCSPDGVAIIDTSHLTFLGSRITEDSNEIIASIEIKTCIAESSSDRAIGRATVDTICCTVGDDQFCRYIPKEHMGQIIQQMTVLSLNHTIYVCAAEVGLMYVAIVYCPRGVINMCSHTLKTSAEPLHPWAYEENASVPAFADRKTKQLLTDRICFWRSVNSAVIENMLFPPLKLFKHGSQSMYSKTKGGVDRVAQARAILRSSTSVFH